MQEVVVVIDARRRGDLRDGLVHGGIAHAGAIGPELVAAGAGQRAGALGAARTGVFGGLDVADLAEGGEEWVVVVLRH
ncbi:hypothetical protein B7463_g12666, partial [Scytalidium lignicola]